MLENIKSSFFVKIIFSFLNNKTKLKLLKYNKSLQNKIDISLINYKILSQRYIVNEENGKVKEYMGYHDALKFEGEYSNGERNGKGREYDYEGKLKFEGEFKNGKRNGKAKEYYNGKLVFEGEYKDGLKNGKAKEYINGNLKFEGEYKNGKKWNGKGYDDKNNIIYELEKGSGYIKEFGGFDKLIFEGEYKNGETNGIGKEYDWDGGLRFQGEYKNGIRNGNGKEYDEGKLLFEGKFLNGSRWDGKGYDHKNNIVYEFKNGTGFIKEYDNFGDLKFEGNFLNGELNGKVKKYICGKLSMEEEYLNGKLNGKQKFYRFLNGKLIYDYDYINEILMKGKEYNYDGELQFEGEYLYGHKWKGKAYIKGKLEYEGEFLFKKKYNGKGYDENRNIIYELVNGNGRVKEYDEKERLIFEGEYLNGKRWNGKVKEYNFDGTKFEETEYINGEKYIK